MEDNQQKPKRILRSFIVGQVVNFGFMNRNKRVIGVVTSDDIQVVCVRLSVPYKGKNEDWEEGEIKTCRKSQIK